jgi:hypothetical protein
MPFWLLAMTLAMRAAVPERVKIRAVSAGFFGVNLELFCLTWQMLFVMVVIGAQSGGRRNWPIIQEWANRLCFAFPESEPLP